MGHKNLYINKQSKAIQTIDVGMGGDKYKVFNLTDLEDVIYCMSMVSFGLGGTVQIEFKSK